MHDKKTRSALHEQENIAGICHITFPIIKLKTVIPKANGYGLFYNLSHPSSVDPIVKRTLFIIAR